MNGFVDIYTIIFLVVAVAIFWRLRSVLGRRTGSERPPFDPFSRRKEEQPPPAAGAPAETNDNVVALPRGGRQQESSASAVASGRPRGHGAQCGAPHHRLGRPRLRPGAFRNRRQGGLRDDRHRLRRGRP